MKKLSIVVPVYNVENYLRKCIDSLVAITNIEYEIFLIDDGSTDKSGQICDEFAQQYADKITVIHKENGGVSSARNKGIELATGEWIYFCDADDWIESDLFSDLFFDNNVDFIKFGVIKHNKNISYKVTEESGVYEIKTSNQHVNYCGPVNIIFKRDLIKNNNIFFSTNLKLGEDQEFLIKYFLLSNKYKITNQCIYNICIREGSATNSKDTSKRAYRDLFTLLENLDRWFRHNSIIMPQWMNIRFERIIKSAFVNYSRCSYNYSETKKLKKLIKCLYKKYKNLPFCHSFYFYIAKTIPSLFFLLLKIKYYKR